MKEQKKSKKEILLEEINELNHRLEECRKMGKDCSQHRRQLIKLIIELDNLEKDKEYEDS